MKYWEQDGNIIYQGHGLNILQGLEAESIQCVATSPPYWGLRNYGLPPMIWDADENSCYSDHFHKWGDKGSRSTGRHDHGSGIDSSSNLIGNTKGAVSPGPQTASTGQFCQLCGAWRGSLGLEPDINLYIDHLVQIFREVKRVLRKDGTVFLNLGDSYAGGKGTCFNPGGGRGSFSTHGDKKDAGVYPLDRGNVSALKAAGLKPKDLCEIPSGVVKALRADGWWLRSRMPWVKRSAMPESADDRPASALEYVFLLTKSQKYYFDMDAVKVKSITNDDRKPYAPGQVDNRGNGHDRNGGKHTGRDTSGRNFRNTDLFYQSIQPPYGIISIDTVNEDGSYSPELIGLDVNPYPMKEAHFATFPPKLVEPLILAGTSEKGCCPECLSPWERVVEKINPPRRKENRRTPPGQTKNTIPLNVNDEVPLSKTIGWKPTCKCYGTDPFPGCPKRKTVDMPEKTLTGWQRGPGSHDKIPKGNYSGAIKRDESDEDYEVRIAPIRQEQLRLLELWKPLKTIPCVVADIFFGSGTVGIVAHKHGRNFIGIELSEKYLKDIAIPRIEKETVQTKWC